MESLEDNRVLTFERIKKFLIDQEGFVPFIQRPRSSSPLSIYDLAVIVQFLSYHENYVIGPSRYAPLSENERHILNSKTYVRKSAVSPLYTSYVMEQDFIDQLVTPSEYFWIYEPYRSVNVDQRVVDLLVVGLEKSKVDMTWRELVERYYNKRAHVMRKAERLREILEEMVSKDLALAVILRGSVGSEKRYPTEDDLDVVILTPSQETHSSIKSILVENVDGFRTLNIGDDESFMIDRDEEYELDVDLISAEWLPLHPIMARAHIDIIEDSTTILGQEAIEHYKSRLEEIAARR